MIEAITNFVQMRKAIKKPMTDKAIQLMPKKLKGLSESEDIQIKILEQSILNSWQGIFPLKEENSKANNYKPQKAERSFNNFEGREYNYDDLEKKLLGWDDKDT